jgi:hypothetical protein
MIALLLILATLMVGTESRCDNACSGHGKCLYDDVCQCFDNWGVGMSYDSGDCSERICPFELAWVDTPDGDGKFHKYQECAGKGICDRDTGECECFKGYEGKGCQRTSCPNLCSGHGTCEYIEDILPTGHHNFPNKTDYNQNGLSWASVKVPGSGFDEDMSFGQDWLAAERYRVSYYGWDKHKTRGCVCDAQYGDVDCSKRMCPYGTDRLAQRDNLLVSEKHQIQRLHFYPKNATASGSAITGSGYQDDLDGQTFSVTFRSKLNETFTTIPIVFNLEDTSDMADDIRLALLTLPNKVIDGVKVTATKVSTQQSNIAAAAPKSLIVDVEFTGASVEGPQHPLWVEAYECASGCSPKITGLDIQVDVSATSNFDTTAAEIYGSQGSGTGEHQLSDFNSYECGRRGKCDYATGLCDCFAGYTGENCNTQTTLV